MIPAPFFSLLEKSYIGTPPLVKQGLLEESIFNNTLSGLKELLNTLGNWGEEILNYFDYQITNGFVDGKNKRIKAIKRMAYSYRNMANFRLRILATNPGSVELYVPFR